MSEVKKYAAIVTKAMAEDEPFCRDYLAHLMKDEGYEPVGPITVSELGEPWDLEDAELLDRARNSRRIEVEVRAALKP